MLLTGEIYGLISVQVFSVLGDMSGEHVKGYGTKCTHPLVCKLTHWVLLVLTMEVRAILCDRRVSRRLKELFVPTGLKEIEGAICLDR